MTHDDDPLTPIGGPARRVSRLDREIERLRTSPSIPSIRSFPEYP